MLSVHYLRSAFNKLKNVVVSALMEYLVTPAFFDNHIIKGTHYYVTLFEIQYTDWPQFDRHTTGSHAIRRIYFILHVQGHPCIVVDILKLFYIAFPHALISIEAERIQDVIVCSVDHPIHFSASMFISYIFHVLRMKSSWWFIYLTLGFHFVEFIVGIGS